MITVSIWGGVISGILYLICPMIIQWGAYNAVRIVGWRKISTLFFLVGLKQLLMVYNIFRPIPIFLSIFTAMNTIAVSVFTIMLWEAISRKPPRRFEDLPVERATTYINKLPFPACIVDLHGEALALNEAYTKLMGIGIEEARNPGWKKYVSSFDYYRIRKAWMNFFEMRTDTFDETFIWEHPTRGPIKIHAVGHVNGQSVFCAVQDISADLTLNRLKLLVNSCKIGD